MKKTKLCITLTVAVFINTALFSQDHEHEYEHDWSCDETVHGIVDNIHMDCTNEEIVITSFQEDLNGTRIRGVITTLGGVTIKPGYSFVRIIPEEGTSDGLHGTTKIGNNGNIGRLLEKNNSFSGSTICNTGYSKEDYTFCSFITRMKNLGSPDMILIFVGKKQNTQ
mgnify:CR=1 FL=1